MLINICFLHLVFYWFNMTIQSKLYDILPEHYGYVLLVGAASVFVNAWMGMNVGKARKKYEVKVSTL